jgi:hypothetical protein
MPSRELHCLFSYYSTCILVNLSNKYLFSFGPCTVTALDQVRSAENLKVCCSLTVALGLDSMISAT